MAPRRSLSAFAYLRVSGDEQADRGLPIAGQREAIARYADEHNLRILRCFVDETHSGSSNVRRDNYCQTIREALEKSDRQEARRLLATLIEEIVVDAVSAKVRYRLPFVTSTGL